MFKKVIFVKSSEKKNQKDGIFKWLIKDDKNFFCFSPQPLTINKEYEIAYYKGSNGAFRIGEIKEKGEIKPQIIQNIVINKINIFVNWNNYYNCQKPRCLSCQKKGIKENELKFCSNEKMSEAEYFCLVKHFIKFQVPFLGVEVEKDKPKKLTKISLN